jgi:hydroxyacylglutathione hydrolase
MNSISESPLEIKQLELGPMENYIYIVANKDTKEAVVVDPAWDITKIESELKKENYKLQAALITHGHADHTNGIEELLKIYDIPIYVSEHEASFYKPIGENIKEVKKNHQLILGDAKSNIEINFVHTPGHTPGSQCFFINTKKKEFKANDQIKFFSEHLLVSGDTLFLDGCGRCDMPGGDVEEMYNTIANILMQMPDDTVIFPGHNYHHYCCDSLKNQKKSNPYMQYENLKGFINKRLG